MHGQLIRSDNPAITSTAGRRRLNLHWALELETTKPASARDEQVDSETSLRKSRKLDRASSDSRMIHVHLDNVRHHNAKMPKITPERLGRPQPVEPPVARPTTSQIHRGLWRTVPLVAVRIQAHLPALDYEFEMHPLDGAASSLMATLTDFASGWEANSPRRPMRPMLRRQ